jgi:hypothetical protein
MKRKEGLELIAFSFLMLLVPVIFLFAYHVFNIEFMWQPFILGALGWYIALMLRIPFIFIIRKLHISDSRKTTLTIGLSGPTEETTRLLFVLLIGFDFHNALLLALGWASIEVIYAIVQAIALVNLRSRTDEKAMKAKGMIEAQGMGTILQDHSPLLAIVERISATCIHLGFTVLLVVNPFIVLIDMIIHSCINLFAVYMVKKSVLLTELYLFFISAFLLIAALLLYFR